MGLLLNIYKIARLNVVERVDKTLRHYLELKVRQLSELGGSAYRDRSALFECMDAKTAESAVHLIQLAQSVYHEDTCTVHETNQGNS